MGTTNYVNTFIQVAGDCPVSSAEAPPTRGRMPTVAALQYALITERPYQLTSDDVLFQAFAIRHGIPEQSRAETREIFFAKSQACLRSSPLGKRYGWGIHHDSEGRVGLVPIDSDRYTALSNDPSVSQTTAMRSARA